MRLDLARVLISTARKLVAWANRLEAVDERRARNGWRVTWTVGRDYAPTSGDA